MIGNRVTVLLASIAFAAATLQTAGAAEQAMAKLKNPKGESVGEVKLMQTPHGTLLHARFSNLPPGAHAFHVHAVGKCEPPFKSAGGHFNPGGKKHGIHAAEGLHAGDMPNIHVPASGSPGDRGAEHAARARFEPVRRRRRGDRAARGAGRLQIGPGGRGRRADRLRRDREVTREESIAGVPPVVFVVR